ncbi:MAG: CHAT domain-containing protein, partial [Chitinophagaceae bacterium]
ENTTLVRYFFIEKELYALVADKNQKRLFPLKSEGVEEYISTISQYSSAVNKTTDALHQLYQSLWAPIAKEVKHKKIIIVPDGILFTLNFEILTPARIHQFEELASQSLLASHTISYHYSLSLVGQKPKKVVKDLDNFVAFAPGFLDEEKKRYQAGIEDSFNIDRGYLSLLPQPFTLAFVSRAQNILGGKAYTNEASTAASFRNNAGRNRIIHIGTHAESNNLVPEFSRLIFSKTGEVDKQNSIYLHELYNCDLTSDLAVLTACESGRPGYQDGEGMISLAHAFNYAGSESILTGLWKIDEKASTILMENFYRHLVDGMDKDEALRQAKLEYLRTSKGRMLAPQYWAGLVLMGDTSPVQLQKPSSNRIWVIAGLVLLLTIPAFYIYKKRKPRNV